MPLALLQRGFIPWIVWPCRISALWRNTRAHADTLRVLVVLGAGNHKSTVTHNEFTCYTLSFDGD